MRKERICRTSSGKFWRVTYFVLLQLLCLQRSDAQVQSHIDKPRHVEAMLHWQYSKKSQEATLCEPLWCDYLHIIFTLELDQVTHQRRWCHWRRCRTCRRMPSWHLRPRPQKEMAQRAQFSELLASFSLNMDNLTNIDNDNI